MPVDYKAVRDRVSISEILRQYGFAIPEHGKYAILCPFHPERTASMHVDEQKGLFHCFGCSVSGSVIDLVARFEKISPSEAAQRLSQEFEVASISTFKIDARKVQTRFSAWHTKSEDKSISIPYDLRDLPAGYRDLSKRAIDHFQLSLTDNGVFFPHFDVNGKLVGYSVRQPDGILPKYLNSTGFPKSIPYGTYQNKREIIKRGFAIVVEGQIDCATVWDRGYPNVVSLMGSSMTEAQAHLLLSLTTRLVLLFDGDKAGRIGAARTNRRWSKCFTIKIALLPNGVDPASYLREASNVSTFGPREDNI